MNRAEKFGLPMQPGEPSWASWKCGGGPHKSDFEEMNQPAASVDTENTKTAPDKPADGQVVNTDDIILKIIRQRGTQNDRRTCGLPIDNAESSANDNSHGPHRYDHHDY